MDRLIEMRINAARRAIIAGGGPQELAREMSRYLSTEFSVDRIAKWRYTGIPCKWGVIIEHLTGVKREDLNPAEYTADPQDIHKFYHTKKSVKATG